MEKTYNFEIYYNHSEEINIEAKSLKEAMFKLSIQLFNKGSLSMEELNIQVNYNNKDVSDRLKI